VIGRSDLGIPAAEIQERLAFFRSCDGDPREQRGEVLLGETV
jgi:hypothetical protein